MIWEAMSGAMAFQYLRDWTRGRSEAGAGGAAASEARGHRVPEVGDSAVTPRDGAGEVFSVEGLPTGHRGESGLRICVLPRDAKPGIPRLRPRAPTVNGFEAAGLEPRQDNLVGDDHSAAARTPSPRDQLENVAAARNSKRPDWAFQWWPRLSSPSRQGFARWGCQRQACQIPCSFERRLLADLAIFPMDHTMVASR